MIAYCTYSVKIDNKNYGIFDISLLIIRLSISNVAYCFVLYVRFYIRKIYLFRPTYLDLHCERKKGTAHFSS